ncbi:3-phosphoshikimate 1-carboxyvinyltransferase [Mycetocola spongiae]|uniref:3-phosphoshikimate 1-carboxyvinyltransferase n=1 Tax=Mycetocola spongiae TaxID=2859226 RepID=UPI001CF5EAEF|nr:3-phosphoshikimate 1-carboxyvinyltransferase [Mycetocola spongiae]UCR90283.1 3-phosphoshikimate 1-carboxyvinyltransferase [Mycetocola spongiae]
MLESRYSAPEFDIYARHRPSEDGGDWPAPTAEAPIDAIVPLPGSKSLTNRELIIAALADGPTLLRAPLHSMDSDAMVAGLRALGTRIEEVPAAGSGAFGPDLRITPAEELMGSTTVDCALAGTVMRFLPPVAALALGPTMIDADSAARGRPMGTIIASLRTLGVDINDDGRAALPFTVHGTGSVRGGEVAVDASASSQFVSGLLLSAARFNEGLDLRHTGERLPSIPHIDMTIDVLAQHGVTVENPEPGHWIVTPQEIRAADVDIEPDLSNAAPFLVAAVATGGRVSIPGWPSQTTQVGAHLAELLPLFGAEVSLEDGVLTVRGTGTITGADIDLTIGGELAPPLAALAALAETPTTLTGIGHIRHHETDRLAALRTEIEKLGGRVEELEDGLRITPQPLHGGQWLSYHDHRMATAGAIIGLRVPGVEIENVATTAKTMPLFPEMWHRMLAGGGAPAATGFTLGSSL